MRTWDARFPRKLLTYRAADSLSQISPWYLWRVVGLARSLWDHMGGGMGALTFALAEKLLGCTRVLAGVLLSLLCPAGKVGVSQVQVTGSHFWVQGH